MVFRNHKIKIFMIWILYDFNISLISEVLNVLNQEINCTAVLLYSNARKMKWNKRMQQLVWKLEGIKIKIQKATKCLHPKCLRIQKSTYVTKKISFTHHFCGKTGQSFFDGRSVSVFRSLVPSFWCRRKTCKIYTHCKQKISRANLFVCTFYGAETFKREKKEWYFVPVTVLRGF